MVWRNRKKICQIINDYLYLPFFLLIIFMGASVHTAHVETSESSESAHQCHFITRESLKTDVFWREDIFNLEMRLNKCIPSPDFRTFITRISSSNFRCYSHMRFCRKKREKIDKDTSTFCTIFGGFLQLI